MKLATTFLIFLLGTLTMHQASSDSLKCGNKLVDVGDSEYELLDRCGEPSAREGNMWFYDRGPDEQTMIVRVSEGVVRSIQTELGEKP
jgi:hypothetical protein